MRRLVALVVAVALLSGCAPRCPPVVIVSQGGGVVGQADIDEAWAEALVVFGGEPGWKCPVGPGRVLVVPSSLYLGGMQWYGITTFEPTDVEGIVQMIPTVEIHLNDRHRCHVREVLVHEMGHLILTRRLFTDPAFAGQAEAFESEEDMLRALYPPGEMGVCP